jgi:protocatechuate 3,4-dioxygenase beta subunit
VVLSVPLRRGGSVSGLVTQLMTKAPLPFVTLRFAEPRGSSAQTTTDEHGRYVIEHLNPGRYQVTVESPGWFPERPLELRLGGGQAEPAVFDVALLGAGVLTGQVVMAEGAPVKGARVWLTGGGQIVRSARGSGRPLETFSGASGQWTLEDVPPHLVVVVRAQLGSLEATPVGANMKQPPAAPLRLVLAGTVNLQGRVLDQGDGSPVANARVQIAPKGPPWGREGRSLTTDAEGAFRTEALIAGDYEITPRRGDYLASPPRLVTLAADEPEERVELALDPGLVFAGLLTDEHGRPLVGSVVADGTPDGQTSPLRRSQTTGPDGRFRLTGFQPGLYRVRANAKGYKGQVLDGLRGGESRLRFQLVAVTPPQGS